MNEGSKHTTTPIPTEGKSVVRLLREDIDASKEEVKRNPIKIALLFILAAAPFYLIGAGASYLEYNARYCNVTYSASASQGILLAQSKYYIINESQQWYNPPGKVGMNQDQTYTYYGKLWNGTKPDAYGLNCTLDLIRFWNEITNEKV